MKSHYKKEKKNLLSLPDFENTMFQLNENGLCTGLHSFPYVRHTISFNFQKAFWIKHPYSYHSTFMLPTDMKLLMDCCIPLINHHNAPFWESVQYRYIVATGQPFILFKYTSKIHIPNYCVHIRPETSIKDSRV